MYVIVKIVLLFVLTLGLHAQSGLTQAHLVSVTPTASQLGVGANTVIAIVFDKPIVSTSVHKDTVVLQNNKTIQGKTVIEDNNTLKFTPNEALVNGVYKVFIKKVKLQIAPENTPIEKPKSGYKKFFYELCAFFYEDVSQCPLCQLFCDLKTEKTQKINYSFSINDNTPIVESIALDKTTVEINEGNQTIITVTATLSDGSYKEITDVEWIIENKTVVSVINNVVHALRAGNTTLQAKYDNKRSNILNIHVYEEINGYRLPPEPNEAVSNSTLVGIDVNNNGVRDDVERYIIKRYAQDLKYPKTKTAIALQYAWASQKILENPTMESKKYIDDALDCQYYWFHKKQKNITDQMIQVADSNMSAFWKLKVQRSQWKRDNNTFNDPLLKDKIYNTRVRIEQKFRFNASLSGNIFNGREESIDNCRTNIDKMGE